jgi:hypothetical protein
VLQQREGPFLGGIGFGPVGVELGQVRPDCHLQIAVGAAAGQLHQRALDRGDVDVLLGGQVEVGGFGDLGDHPDLISAELAGAERGLGGRQGLQCPPVCDEVLGQRSGDPQMSAQPRLHRLRRVVLARTAHIGAAGDPDGMGGEAADRGDHVPEVVQQRPVGELVEVHAGECGQCRPQLAHDPSSSLRMYVRF